MQHLSQLLLLFVILVDLCIRAISYLVAAIARLSKLLALSPGKESGHCPLSVELSEFLIS